jgi:hypothetical protein
MLHKRVEVAITEEESETALNATRCNHCINRLSDRNSQRPQHPKILGSLNCHLPPSEVNDYQGCEQLLRLIEFPLLVKALQHLCQYQVSCRDGLTAQKRIEPFRLRRWCSSKVVDPYARIHQNHLSVLIASRSPCQFSLPRNFLISSCCRSRSNVRRPSSTASRLVLRPVARSVSFMSLSSITIFVRMMCRSVLKCTHSKQRSAVLQGEKEPNNSSWIVRAKQIHDLGGLLDKPGAGALAEPRRKYLFWICPGLKRYVEDGSPMAHLKRATTVLVGTGRPGIAGSK